MLDANSSLRNGDIVVRATDTDILVILLHHCHKVSMNVWMDVGTSGRGNRRYVNISAIATQIGYQLCKALPGFHAYTGCDYTAAFIRKGKKRPLAIAEKDEQYLDALYALASGPVDDATCKVIEEFTGKMYGAKKKTPLNKHRYLIFEKTFGPKNGKQPFAKLKGLDASSIPPSESVVRQKIHRSNFVAMMWHAAGDNLLPKEPQHGWELHDNSYSIVWFTCPQMPESVIPENSESNEDDEEDGDINYHCDSDTDVDDDSSDTDSDVDDDDDD